MAEKRTPQASRAGRPWDLVVVVLATLLAAAMVFVPFFSGSPIQVVFVLPLLVFLPGYAFVSALYVRRAAVREANGEEVIPRLARGLDGPARVVLSVLASVILVSATALAVNFTPFGVRRVPMVVAVTALTLAFAVAAVARRSSVPRRERFTPAVPSAVAGGWSFRGDSTVGTALNVVLAASLFLALATTAYALAAPPSPQGDSFTEFYVLSENESGELVANDYPRDLTVGEPTQLTAAVANHEGQSQEYTVVVLQQRVRTNGSGNDTEVVASEELRRLNASVESGETAYLNHSVTPAASGEDVRLTYLLYRGDAPADPTAEDAYRTLRLYVDVSEGSA
ncbi:DUF1616 domain-containing protein [Halopelagius longus]|nr:DUF1616 domain-containing protein [Halopelagius longus]SDR12983.1 Uncharacterized membrane protein [Halopelagius longus]